MEDEAATLITTPPDKGLQAPQEPGVDSLGDDLGIKFKEEDPLGTVRESPPISAERNDVPLDTASPTQESDGPASTPFHEDAPTTAGSAGFDENAASEDDGGLESFRRVEYVPNGLIENIVLAFLGGMLSITLAASFAGAAHGLKSRPSLVLYIFLTLSIVALPIAEEFEYDISKNHSLTAAFVISALTLSGVLASWWDAFIRSMTALARGFKIFVIATALCSIPIIVWPDECNRQLLGFLVVSIAVAFWLILINDIKEKSDIRIFPRRLLRKFSRGQEDCDLDDSAVGKK